MTNHIEFTEEQLSDITPAVKCLLNKTKEKLKGTDKRQFMAHVVSLMGKGGQRKAEKELGWNRDTIRKGMKELQSGFVCIDNFSGRGRKPAEEKYPSLLGVFGTTPRKGVFQNFRVMRFSQDSDIR
nr:hypothetical protein [uncultured Desulfobacter sp.]